MADEAVQAEIESPGNPWAQLGDFDLTSQVRTLILVVENLSQKIELLENRIATIEQARGRATATQ
jgi:hypothetical protein